jgi:hypothetical protein
VRRGFLQNASRPVAGCPDPARAALSDEGRRSDHAFPTLRALDDDARVRAPSEGADELATDSRAWATARSRVQSQSIIGRVQRP